MEIIKVKVHSQDDVYFLSSEDPEWESIMNKLWAGLLADDDTLEKNSSNQFPLCNIYKDRTLYLDKYLCIQSLAYMEWIGRMTFGDMDFKAGKRTNILTWGSIRGNCEPGILLEILNKYLRDHSVELVE